MTSTTRIITKWMEAVLSCRSLPAPWYTASNQWNSGYIGLPLPLFKEKLNILCRHRYDYYRFRMAATGREGYSVVYPIEVDNTDKYVLPSINISWNVSTQHGGAGSLCAFN